MLEEPDAKKHIRQQLVTAALANVQVWLAVANKALSQMDVMDQQS